MKILTVSQMQKAERECDGYGISLDQLMENAGLAFSKQTRNVSGNLKDPNILLLIGPGNNGGDGLVAARHLHDWGLKVNIYLCGKRPPGDSNLEKVKARNIECIEAENDTAFGRLYQFLSQANCVIDAIFGTGQNRPITGIYASVLKIAADYKKRLPETRVIALDLPSGLNADSGAVDQVTLPADNTITLGFPKVGLFNLPGSEVAGKIDVVDIGIPSKLVDYVKTDLLDDNLARKILPQRPRVSHKGTFGKVLALVGSQNYIGAAFLACSGSMRAGAGLTTLAVASSLLPVLAGKLTEATYLPLTEDQAGKFSQDALDQIYEYLPGYDVFLAGCGIGLNETTVNLFKNILFQTRIKLPAVVVDADGLTILAGIPHWQEQFVSNAVLTPHAAEMARLSGKSIAEIQTNRIQVLQQAASQWHKVLVLKGAYTVIAAPDGRTSVSQFANPGLATAGTGDVLAGAIAGLAAQGLDLFEAAVCGVYIHGLAGEIVRSEMGDAGMLASDLLPALPRAIRQLKQG